jgi:hypothetical protein
VIRLLQEKRAEKFPPIFEHKFRTAVVTGRVDDLPKPKAGPPIWGSILNMSDDTESKVQAAGTMMAAAAVNFAAKEAMRANALGDEFVLSPIPNDQQVVQGQTCVVEHRPTTKLSKKALGATRLCGPHVPKCKPHHKCVFRDGPRRQEQG